MPNNASSLKPGDVPCPHCGSTHMLFKEVRSAGVGGPDLLPGVCAFLQNAKFHIYVCHDCGYVQWFVAPQNLAEVRQKFEAISDQHGHLRG